MTQPESRTVEAAEILARVRFEREHRMKWEDVRGGTGEHLAASYLSDAYADIAAAKEHGLVIGEGELDQERLGEAIDAVAVDVDVNEGICVSSRDVGSIAAEYERLRR